MIESKEIKSIDKLDLLAKKIVEGYLLGLHRSPFHGFSSEFREHKQYHIGDNPRNIDYKVYARTDKLFVKKYDEETNLRCQMVLDVSKSMFFPENVKKTKFDFSAVAIASLIHLLKRQRDAFGLTTIADDIVQQIDPRLSEKNKQQIYSTLNHYLQHGSEYRSSRLLFSLDQLAYSLPKRSMIIVFSDFLDEMDYANFEDKFNQVIQHLMFQKHELILFHVLDQKTELNFDYEAVPTEFIDQESGETIRLTPFEVKSEFQEFMKRRLDFIKVRCIQYGIDFIEVDIQDDYHLILSTYLRKRKKHI